MKSPRIIVFSFEKLNDTKGACDDFKKAASLGSEYAKKWLKSIDGEDCKKKLF